MRISREQGKRDENKVLALYSKWQETRDGKVKKRLLSQVRHLEKEKPDFNIRDPFRTAF